MRITLLNKTAGGISGGYRKYLCAMLPRLESDPRVSSVQCVAPSSWRATEWLSFGADTALIEYAASRLARIPAHVRTEIVRFAPDVVFVPSERTFHYPLAPVVNMFRNLEPFTDGIRHSVLKNIVTIARRCDARRMFTRTAKLIVPSEFVRNYLVTQESVPSELLSVVHYGSDDLASERSGVKRPFAVAQKQVQPGFLFTAGAVCPARGLEDVLHALVTIRDRYGRNAQLVVAGDVGPHARGYANGLQRLCHRLRLSRQVVWLGHLSRRELYWCFQHCAAFLLTTRAETFSNIAIEALANGCMIVATNSSCLPEILADVAYYYTPGDSRRLGDAAVAAADLRGEERARRMSACRCRAAEFDWDTTAIRTVDVLSATLHATTGIAA